MNKSLSGTIIIWQTKNVRKMRRAEVWCADFGLSRIHKGLVTGFLYERERKALELKFKGLLNGRYDMYCIFTLCGLCLKEVNTTYGIIQKPKPYELV